MNFDFSAHSPPDPDPGPYYDKARRLPGRWPERRRIRMHVANNERDCAIVQGEKVRARPDCDPRAANPQAIGSREALENVLRTAGDSGDNLPI